MGFPENKYAIKVVNMKLISLYDYVGVTDKELSFKKDEVFELLDSEHEDWW